VAAPDATEQAFIFDLDGTLADTMPVHFGVWQIIAERHGLVFPEERFYSLGTLTLATLGITDWFGAVVAAEDTVRHKPEPDVFLEAARRLGVAPSCCTVYEDTDLGLESARRAGMRGVDVRPIILASR